MDVSTGPLTGFGWQLIGGDLAVDLVNTVAYRTDPSRTVDRLADLRHLADWLAVAAPRHGWPVNLSSRSLAGSSRRDALDEVRRLREAVAAVLNAQVDGEQPPGEAMELIRRSYEDALTRAVVPPRLPLRYEVEVQSTDEAPTLLALAAGRLCTRHDLERLQRCAASDCGWYFLDTSRNRSRRWCDPGDCGNRTRVRAFAARQRAGSR
jgi:predicted RNA-binding Zn ribbon-like protein